MMSKPREGFFLFFLNRTPCAQVGCAHGLDDSKGMELWSMTETRAGCGFSAGGQLGPMGRGKLQPRESERNQEPGQGQPPRVAPHYPHTWGSLEGKC